ncbi:MAG: phosphatase PAP2 family protein [Acidobacteriia bacterium]|nr:phosphatase PAP2 family protein [Terriglobia bacterium]
MNRKGVKILLNCCILVASQALCTICSAQAPNGQSAQNSSLVESADTSTVTGTQVGPNDEPKLLDEEREPAAIGDENVVGTSFLKNLVSDQKSIWTSPAHIRWADGSWLFPLAATTAGFLASDRAVPPALSSDPKKLNRYVTFSNYGLYSMIGAGAGMYVWGKVSHNDHQSETGFLAGEAAIDSFAVGTALKYSFGRERPDQGQGLGHFFSGGASFPSDHSAVAWSIASVVAHEYPGPFTKLLVYGLATAVSASRVTGEQHFPSDVVVGAAIGWLIGRQVYRAHHDSELGGGGWGSLSGEFSEDQRDRRRMGSPSVPLDSWVYPAFERLAGLRVINTQIMGVKPWTRIECARLAEEAGENLQQNQSATSEEVAQLQAQLAQEFAYEINLLGGGRNFTANLESVYARAVSISGPALTDGFHFGQTVSYDFGRPFESGRNEQVGGSFSGSAGPLTLYVRAEYQHAPPSPALPVAAASAVSVADAVPLSEVHAGPFAAINRPQLLDAYVGVNLHNWQITLGKQSLSWTPGPGGSMLLSDNIAPINMVRMENPEPFHLPALLRYFGPVRIDQFFGRLEGHPYVPRPFEYGQKLSMKPLPFLELGFARTVTLGGHGSGNPLNSRIFLQSYLGLHNNALNSVPGDSHTEMDWALYVPGVRNYIVLYGDAYADDDILPIKNPPKNPWHPGIYITKFPLLPKLDLHVDSVSTEQPGFSFDNFYTGGPANRGQFNYWNGNYPDGYTNAGNLIGNTVGRDGRAFQAWLTYWLSSRSDLQFFYKKSSVASEFIPGGGSWQDYSVRNEVRLRSGFYMKTEFQFEHISRYPVLFSGPQRNFTVIAEIGFHPRQRGGQ